MKGVHASAQQVIQIGLMPVAAVAPHKDPNGHLARELKGPDPKLQGHVVWPQACAAAEGFHLDFSPVNAGFQLPCVQANP